MARYESRLSRRSERQSKKNFILSIFGIAIILFAFFKIILPLLLNANTFLSSNKDVNNTKKNSDTFVAAPYLNQAYDATNSAQISISGNALPKENVKLFVNDEEIDSSPTKDDGSFSFNSVKLQQGKNEIKAKAIVDNKNESDFSNLVSIVYSDKQPALSVDTPTDGQSFSKDQNQVNVTGKTDPGDKVTVNGFWALVDDNGKYSYTMQLSNGDNKIEVITTDSAGNQTKLTKTVKYSS